MSDVVGMTTVSEATLAAENGLRFAGIYSVDNYTDGITAKALNFEDVVKLAKENATRIEKILVRLSEGMW